MAILKNILYSKFDPNKQYFKITEGNSDNMECDIDNKKLPRYVLYHHQAAGVSIIWNIDWRRKIGQLAHYYTLPAECKHYEFKSDSLEIIYRKLKKQKFEKVLIVGDDYIEHVLSTIDTYFKFNEFDDGFYCGISKEYCDWGTSHERERESLTRWKRDQEFRKKVLARYKNQCAICRCNVVEILDAAHMKEHEVSRGNVLDDDPKYGVCLCKNHHAMYDKGLIKIDFENKTITCTDPRLKEMAWFEDFNAKYKGEILCPNS